jgi:hypothetical protein
MNLAQQIQLVQQKTDTINQALAAVTDSTKSLTADILKSLVLYARGREVDGRLTTNVWTEKEYELSGLAAAEAGHYQQLQTLTKQLSDQLAEMSILSNQLVTLRTYLRVGTDAELSEALSAGHSVPLSTAELEAAKAAAIARAKAHQASTTTKP